MGLSDSERVALKEIQKEGFEEAFSGRAKPKLPFYKLLNLSPNSSPEQMTAFEPGIRLDNGELAQEIKAVILVTFDGRRLTKKVDGKFQTTCCSFDGEVPAPKIVEPECKKLGVEGLVAILSKFKGYDKTKIDEKVAELTEGSDKLTFCSIKTAQDYIPICPKARWNTEAEVAGPCKQVVHLFAYDIERSQVFKMELTGRSIMTGKKFQSPLAKYRKWLGQQRVNCYSFAVVLSPAKDGNFYHLDVKDYKPIEKADNRSRMKALAHEFYERYMRSAAWTPDMAKKVEAVEIQPEIKPEPKPKAAPKAAREDDYVEAALGGDPLPDDFESF